jgi:hypothetical protein
MTVVARVVLLAAGVGALALAPGSRPDGDPVAVPDAEGVTHQP